MEQISPTTFRNPTEGDVEDLPSFLITGKPGCGKSTLAKILSATWKCVLITDTVALEDLIAGESDLGLEAKNILESGEEVTEEFMADVIAQKIQSAAVTNYGYVLDCLPSMSEGWKTISEQIDFIKCLTKKPTVIVNLRISDQELERRRLDLRIDAHNAKVYNCGGADPPPDDAKDSESNSSEHEDDEKTDTYTEEDIFEDDVGVNLKDELIVPSKDQLMQRPRDFADNIEKEIHFYSDVILKPLESFFMRHNKKFFIELDANLPPKELAKNLLIHLDNLGLSYSPVPLHLFDPEDDEEDTETVDEQLLQKLSEQHNIWPKFRWKCSRWGRYCPVQLADGNLIQGKLEFSVGFRDTMYCLSSVEALQQFTVAPKKYLLPPLPQIPCKICVLGPPTSGKSTLAKMLAQHYDAMVLNIQQLLIEVMAKQKDKLIEDARQEAISKFMTEQRESGETYELDINEHPEILKAVEEATSTIHSASVSMSQGMYMEALTNGINIAETRRRENGQNGQKFGGWIIDSFPMTRENWTAMVDNQLLPDFVISLEDEAAPDDFLLSRFVELHNLPTPASSTTDGNEQEVKEDVKVSEVVTKWQSAKTDYSRQWGQLLASIKGSAIDPIVIDCCLPMDEMVSTAVNQLEDIFSHKVVEYSFMDAEADADDDPDIENGGTGEDEEEDSNQTSQQKKPWGYTRHFCPVALKNDGVFWPGNNEISLRYREKIYCFSSEDAKEKFSANPLEFISGIDKFLLPPLRIFLLGCKSSGKSTLGEHLAEKFHIFHISFREFLQEQLLPKVKKPPLVDKDEWSEDSHDTEGTDNSDEDSDEKVPLTAEEAEIQSYLLNEENLSEEILLKYLEPFWMEEPYKSAGFVLESFPYKSDEMRYFAEKGLYPDVAIILQVEETAVVKRVLPPRLEAWTKKRNERIAKRKLLQDKTMEEWKADKERRKSELKAEYEPSDAHTSSDDESANHDDYLEQLAEIDDEEPPELDEEEEEETEIEAVDRMKSTIVEHFEEQIESISMLQEVFTEFQIPYRVINACRQLSVVKFSVEKCLLPFTDNRDGLLTKCTPVNAEIAKKLLDNGYYSLSPFKKWCPVKLMNASISVLPPITLYKTQQFPVIYHNHIYFTSSSIHRNSFMENPHKFIFQSPPGPSVPVTVSIVGPPKSGKTTIAKRFCSEYGCVRLSIGEVLRRMITKFPHSRLTELIVTNLKAGQIVPEDLCVHALESALLDVQCCTRGFVLDGFPTTKSQVDLLSKFQIVPVCILELLVDESEVMRRGENDRNSPNRTYPVHDSDSILLVRSKQYYDNISGVKNWYMQEHDNWHTISGLHSQWKVWNECNKIALFSAKQTQQYLINITSGKAASLHGLCVTPLKFQLGLGEFHEFCPVNLALRGELVDCSTTKSLAYAAEYRGKFYKMHSREDLEQFLLDPKALVFPKAPHSLPQTSHLPKKKSCTDIKLLFPKQFEINGFCPVCFIDGNKVYECLKPGDQEFSVEFCNKLYSLCSELHLDKFMRKPKCYEESSLPAKLPPLKQVSPITTLPMLGYLEQSIATAIIDCLSAIGIFKPKFPFFSSTKSALYYVGLYLKAFNPKTNKLIREKYKKKLDTFETQCKLIDYLSSSMDSGYKEPVDRPFQFDKQLSTFMHLRTHELSVHQ